MHISRWGIFDFGRVVSLPIFNRCINKMYFGDWMPPEMSERRRSVNLDE
jgi:hypothetical protein